MVNHSNQTTSAQIQLTWSDIFWRLLLTLLLLLMLAGPGLTIFSAVTAKPDNHVLPQPPPSVEQGK